MMRGRTAALAAIPIALGVGVWVAGRGGGGMEMAAPAFAAAEAEAAVRDADIALFEARAKEDPYGGSDRARLAYLYLQRGRETGDYEDYRRAERAAREAVAARGHRNESGWLALSSSLLAQHRFAESLEAARVLVAMDPEKPSYRALLGELQLEMGDYEGARGTFGSLEGDEENLAVAPRLARWEEVRGNTDRARSILIGAARQADVRGDLPLEQAAWFHLRVGDLEARHGRLRQAEDAFRRGLARNPGDARMHAGLARTAWMRGRWKDAIAHGEKAGDRADFNTLSVMGDAHAALGDRAEAERFYRMIEEGNAENPEPYARQWTLFRLDHGREIPATLALLRREIEGRRDVLGYDMLAWALFRAGDFAAARESSKAALRMGTRDASSYFHAGMIERAMGNGDGARKHLRTALEINPRFHPVFAEVARAVLDGRAPPDGW